MKECCKNTNNTPQKQNYLTKLQDKWQLKSIMQVVIVLIVFALGGSTCAYLGRNIMPHLSIETKGVIWWVVYIVIVTILWPVCVLFYSLFFGQYQFFKKYLTKMGKRMVGKK